MPIANGIAIMNTMLMLMIQILSRSKVGSAPLTDAAKYETSTAAMDPFTWRSEFTIYNMTNSDYGDYECLAKNTEGSSKHRILLDVKSRPDAPTQLQVRFLIHRD